MSSIMCTAPRPCIRCKTRLVKFGGITGMCNACRIADPEMAQVQRDNHAALKKSIGDWVMDNTEPDPFGRPGIRKVKRGAFGL